MNIKNRENADHYVWGEMCDGWRLLAQDDLAVTQERIPPGRGEIRHYHTRARQLFYVISGLLDIELESAPFRLGAGDAFEVPPMSQHRVWNETAEDVSFLVISAPTTSGDRVDVPDNSQRAWSAPDLVRQFYERIWNEGDLSAMSELLAADFRFRGSLGQETSGRDAFSAYVRSVRDALADYRCEILALISENDRAFAKMRFSGRHVGVFRGYEPTGKTVEWLGAALFTTSDRRISEVWVLGDLIGLDALLQANRGQ